jgi:acyl-CoA thioesterase-1
MQRKSVLIRIISFKKEIDLEIKRLLRHFKLMFVGVFCCLFLLTGFGCAANSQFIDNLRNGQNQTIVAMGTSLTSDIESQPLGGSQWVAQIRNWLNDEFPGQATVYNYGRGASASSVGGVGGGGAGRSGFAMLATVLAVNPDVIFIEYTVNDAHTPYGISLQDCEDNINTIIDDIYANNPDIEVVLQVMNAFTHAAGITSRPDILAYNQVYRDVAQTRGLLCIDHYWNYLDLINKDLVTFNSYVPDGLHPNATGHENMNIPEIKQSVWPGDPNGTAGGILAVNAANPKNEKGI